MALPTLTATKFPCHVLRLHPPPCPLCSRPPAPKGDDWLHEPKWDGFRFQIIKDGSRVRLYSRHGAEYTDRLPGMVEAFAKLPTQSAILDGELCLIDPRGSAHFYRLMAQMRTSRPDESQKLFLAFDLLHQDGVDLRGLPLSELNAICRRSSCYSRRRSGDDRCVWERPPRDFDPHAELLGCLVGRHVSV